MGDLSEFSLVTRTFLRAYPWRRVEPTPWTPPRPVHEARVALVSTAGFVRKGQDAFDPKVRGGDFSFRRIASDTPVEELTDYHRSESFDHSGLAEDPNLAFPIDRLQELKKQGAVGSVATHHISFMGSITAPGRLVRHSAPAAAEELNEDSVDLAVLVPV